MNSAAAAAAYLSSHTLRLGDEGSPSENGLRKATVAVARKLAVILHASSQSERLRLQH
jgi:hypothetical protein